jgi:hypothetical protein
MVKIIKTLLAVFILIVGFSVKAQEENTAHIDQISEVVEKFRLSIINKDKTTFQSLFYSDSIPWIAVFSDEMVKMKRKENKDFPRSVDFGKYGPPVRMISDEEAQEEKMWNIKIDTDGYLASVHFNYSDHRGGGQKAFGTEAWDLVREESGWKIVSVKYTVTEFVQSKIAQ